MNSEATITLKPKLGYWIARYFLLVVIVFLIPVLIQYLLLDKILYYILLWNMFSRLDYAVLYIYRYAICDSVDNNKRRVNF